MTSRQAHSYISNEQVEILWGRSKNSSKIHYDITLTQGGDSSFANIVPAQPSSALPWILMLRNPSAKNTGCCIDLLALVYFLYFFKKIARVWIRAHAQEQVHCTFLVGLKTGYYVFFVTLCESSCQDNTSYIVLLFKNFSLAVPS